MGRFQKLWLSNCKQGEGLFSSLRIAYDTIDQLSRIFITRFNTLKNIYRHLDIHGSFQKHQTCADADLQCSSSSKTILDLPSAVSRLTLSYFTLCK